VNKRFRLRFHFWLDLNKPDEADLADTIEQLKGKRSFAAAIRDGLRLVVSLAQGDTTVLKRLFPQVVEDIYLSGLEAAKDDFNGDVTQRLDELAALVRQIKPGESQLALAGPKSLSPMASTDDIELDVKAATKSKDSNATWNFLISSAINVHGEASFLPSEIIEYGLRTNRLTEKQAGRAKRKKNIRPDGNPKKMDVPQFEVPSFDDDMLPELSL